MSSARTSVTDLHSMASERAKSTNEPDWFDDVFEHHFGYVCRTLQRLGVQRSDIEDLAQEVFVRVHHLRGRFDRSRPVRPWLFSIALGTARNYRRSKRRRPDSDAFELREVDGSSAAESPHRATERSADRQMLFRILDVLCLEQRALIVMHDVDGFTIREIAESLGIRARAATSRLHVARVAFRKAVDRKREGAEP